MLANLNETAVAKNIQREDIDILLLWDDDGLKCFHPKVRDHFRLPLIRVAEEEKSS